MTNTKHCIIVFVCMIMTHSARPSNQDAISHPCYFSKVVIWGHKLHTHTHSYIHFGFYRAFKHLGYNTYWLDDSDDIHDFDFSNTLFITEGQVDSNIPIRSDCRYVLHYCDHNQKYTQLYQQNNCLRLHVYRHCFVADQEDLEQIEPYIYFRPQAQTLVQPWATDLLPHEIDTVKQQLIQYPKAKENMVYIVATIDKNENDNIYENWSQYEPFYQACIDNGTTWHTSNFYHDRKPLSMEENIDVIQRSLVAPALQGPWQLDEGYIPCRIFKNISYGQMGITNSKTVFELFNQKIIYNADTYKLFYDALHYSHTMPADQLFELMDFVRDYHTYINRINTIFYALNRIKPLAYQQKPQRSQVENMMWNFLRKRKIIIVLHSHRM